MCRIFGVFFLCFICAVCSGQNSSISGYVYLQESKSPLAFANVAIYINNTLIKGTETNDDGYYVIKELGQGAITMEISYISCTPYSSVINIREGENITLDSVFLEKIWFNDINIVERTYDFGDLTMTKNQYKVMPASFQDPARILINYPSFSTPNDGANAIVFRGMPSESTKWQLYGADIVNPNHLSNAGTANDLSTNNAGGVNAISGSVLDNYHFEANPADISYGDVMSGVSNMTLAPKINNYIDLNLIGLEAGLNLTNRNKNIYGSYRYSFVGVLGKLGVDFGNEAIDYQDITLKADLIKNNFQSLKVFGTYGTSSNVFTAVSLGDTITRFKDSQDITFKGKLGMGGLQYDHNKNNKYFSTTFITSFKEDIRIQSTNADYLSLVGDVSDQMASNNEILFSSHSFYSIVNSFSSISMGLRANARNKKYSQLQYDLDNQINILSIYPYLKYTSIFPEKWGGDKHKFTLGLGAMVDDYTKEWTLEPSVNTVMHLSRYNSIKIDYRHASNQNFAEQWLINEIQEKNRIKSHNFQLGLVHSSVKTSFSATLFYHYFWDVANYGFQGLENAHFNMFNGSNGGYSMFNFNALSAITSFSKAKSKGIEINFERSTLHTDNRLTFGLNGSIFSSQYSLPNDDKVYFNAKNAYGYTANLSLSYLIILKNKKSINLALANHMRGGTREQSYSEFNNISSGTLYDPLTSFGNALKPYQRMDFRVIYSRPIGNKKYTSRWSLDIQNLLGNQNDGFRYFDPLLNGVYLQSQLGLIPVLSYKIEW